VEEAIGEAEKRKAEALLRKRWLAAQGLVNKPEGKKSDPTAERERGDVAELSRLG
jgi:hypothetical protein